MRVAVVSGFPPDPFGEAHYAGQAFLSLARQFPEVNILVIAHRNTSAPTHEQLLPNLQVRRITQPYSRIQATIALLPLLTHLIRFRPQIVHFQGAHTPRYGGVFGEPIAVIVAILRFLGIKVVFTAHSIWLRPELAQLWQRHKLVVPLPQWLTWLYAANLRCLARWSNVLSFAVAGEVSPLKEIYATEYSLRREKLTAESHPCTGELVSLGQQRRAQHKLGLSDRLTISAIGFVRPDKGYHLILDCAEKLLDKYPNLVFVIAGLPQETEGQHYAESLLKRRLKIVDSSRVILKLEYLSESELSDWIEASDAVVVPYLQVSGPSGPVHHALGRGKPVIASALGHNLGLADVCKLVPPGDAVALGEAIDELLGQPRVLEDYQTRSVQYASRHTWNHLAQQYMKQYQDLVADSGNVVLQE